MNRKVIVYYFNIIKSNLFKSVRKKSVSLYLLWSSALLNEHLFMILTSYKKIDINTESTLNVHLYSFASKLSQYYAHLKAFET